jgi:hypothetical protein
MNPTQHKAAPLIPYPTQLSVRTMATASTESTKWPPSLQDSDRIIDECEKLEVSATSSDNAPHHKNVCVLHLIALLKELDLVEARHLWRRSASEKRDLLLPWWTNVAIPMLEYNFTGVFQGLPTMAKISPLYETYAKEIAQAYRVSLLKGWMLSGTSPPSYLASALGFSSEAELQEFCEQQQQQQQHAVAGGNTDHMNSASLTEIAAFLESQLAL